MPAVLRGQHEGGLRTVKTLSRFFLAASVAVAVAGCGGGGEGFGALTSPSELTTTYVNNAPTGSYNIVQPPVTPSSANLLAPGQSYSDKRIVYFPPGDATHINLVVNIYQAGQLVKQSSAPISVSSIVQGKSTATVAWDGTNVTITQTSGQPAP
jgi:hypothetical protein